MALDSTTTANEARDQTFRGNGYIETATDTTNEIDRPTRLQRQLQSSTPVMNVTNMQANGDYIRVDDSRSNETRKVQNKQIMLEETANELRSEKHNPSHQQ